MEPRIAFSFWDNVLAETPWKTGHKFELVEWNAFLSDTEPDMAVFAPMVEQMAKHADLPLLNILVGVAGDIFRALRTFQNAPTPAEGFARLHEMREVAKKLAALARGQSSSAARQSDEEMFGSGHLEKRSPGLHPFLHDLLQEIDAPTRQEDQDELAWDRVMFEFSRRNRRLMLFFTLLEGVVDRLTISQKDADKNIALDPRTRSKGVARDKARDWLLIRLMWIWRDVIDKELKIYLPRIGKGFTKGSKPAADSVIAFVCDVLREIEPVPPHELSALEKKLNELRPQVPVGSLFTT